MRNIAAFKEKIVDSILNGLRNTENQYMMSACYAIFEDIASRVPISKKEAVIDLLLNGLHSKDLYVSLYCSKSLVKMTKSLREGWTYFSLSKTLFIIETLINNLRNVDWRVKESSAQVLSFFATEIPTEKIDEVIELLINLGSDEHWVVRVSAIKAFGEMGSYLYRDKKEKIDKIIDALEIIMMNEKESGVIDAILSTYSIFMKLK